ncbi:MAG: HAD-IA family hydrolase [Planctomycetota bacterium]|nr:HAD-IA family hydrolase [Planctomycetota bacterium]MDP6764023.1 HAD-IA family hydrolase [Planctomycetota bacterium]MDP6990113.1 HAD-IA family hydrolase [Planctomycetota bacterium]
MNGATPTTILFDLDGTLIDSVDLILASYRHTLRVHRSVDLPPEHFRPGLGRPLLEQLGSVTSDEAELAAMVETYRAHNHEHHDGAVRAYPGVVSALGALTRSGVALGIVTSKNAATAWRGLECCGLAEHFAVLVGSDDVERHKPDPAPVLAAVERLASARERTVFVGDSPQDLRAGRRAGVRTAAAAWGPFAPAELEAEGPDAWLEAPAAIPGLLGTALRRTRARSPGT